MRKFSLSSVRFQSFMFIFIVLGCLEVAVFSLIVQGWAQVAGAHVEAEQAAGFMAGLHHPGYGLDHILAMVAVGL